MDTELVTFPARKGRSYLPARLYSSAFILGRFFLKSKNDFTFMQSTKELPTKIYTYAGKFYTVPLPEESPGYQYDWQLMGRLHGRDIYVANQRTIQ